MGGDVNSFVIGDVGSGESEWVGRAKGNMSGKESIGMKDFWSREEEDAGRV